jgi:hypothetical protein
MCHAIFHSEVRSGGILPGNDKLQQSTIWFVQVKSPTETDDQETFVEVTVDDFRNLRDSILSFPDRNFRSSGDPEEMNLIEISSFLMPCHIPTLICRGDLSGSHIQMIVSRRKSVEVLA